MELKKEFWVKRVLNSERFLESITMTVGGSQHLCRVLRECNEPKYSERMLFYNLPVSDVNNLNNSITSWEFYENIFSSLIHVYLGQTLINWINVNIAPVVYTSKNNYTLEQCKIFFIEVFPV